MYGMNWRLFTKILPEKIEIHSQFSAGFQQFAKSLRKFSPTKISRYRVGTLLSQYRFAVGLETLATFIRKEKKKLQRENE